MHEFLSRILYWSSFTDQPVTVGDALRFFPWVLFVYVLLLLMCAWAAI